MAPFSQPRQNKNWIGEVCNSLPFAPAWEESNIATDTKGWLCIMNIMNIMNNKNDMDMADAVLAHIQYAKPVWTPPCMAGWFSRYAVTLEWIVPS